MVTRNHFDIYQSLMLCVNMFELCLSEFRVFAYINLRRYCGKMEYMCSRKKDKTYVFWFVQQDFFKNEGGGKWACGVV